MQGDLKRKFLVPCICYPLTFISYSCNPVTVSQKLCSLPVYLPTKPLQTFHRALFSCNCAAVRKVLAQPESFWLSSNSNTFWARQIVLQLCVCNHRSKYQKAGKTQCNPWRKFYEDNTFSQALYFEIRTSYVQKYNFCQTKVLSLVYYQFKTKV